MRPEYWPSWWPKAWRSRAKRLEEMEHQFGEFHVYEVEVCPDCLWNHILVDYVLGDGRRCRPPRHQLQGTDATRILAQLVAESMAQQG
jgi:hypothetical protein